MNKIDFNEAADAYCSELVSKKTGSIFPDWLEQNEVELDLGVEVDIESYPKIYKPITKELIHKILTELFDSCYIVNHAYEHYLGYLMPKDFNVAVVAEIIPDNNPYTIDINTFYDFGWVDITEILLFIKCRITDERLKYSYTIENPGNVWIEIKFLRN